MFEYFLQFSGNRTADVVVLTSMTDPKKTIRKKRRQNFNPNVNVDERCSKEGNFVQN